MKYMLVVKSDDLTVKSVKKIKRKLKKFFGKNKVALLVVGKEDSVTLVSVDGKE